jgi:hypothetical protein
VYCSIIITPIQRQSMEQTIELALLENNDGQIEGIKSNPRSINESDFIKLKQSIKDYPDMLELRELLVVLHNDKYVVIGGNQRLRALRDLGYKEAHCKVIPSHITSDTINAIIIKDNISNGEWDWEMLANAWDYDDLVEWGIDLPDDWYIEDKQDNENNKQALLIDKLFIKIECEDEAHYIQLENEFKKRNLKYKFCHE